MLSGSTGRRENATEARQHKRALQCWQGLAVRKAWATWQDHMGDRARAMQALRAVAVRLQTPVLSTAWRSWQAYTARRGAKQVPARLTAAAAASACLSRGTGCQIGCSACTAWLEDSLDRSLS